MKKLIILILLFIPSLFFAQTNILRQGGFRIDTISINRLNSGGATSGQVLKWNGSIWVPSVDNTGSVSLTNQTIPYGTGTTITSDTRFLRDSLNNDVEVLGPNANFSIKTTDTTGVVTIGNLGLGKPSLSFTSDVDNPFFIPPHPSANSGLITGFGIGRQFFNEPNGLGDNEVVSLGWNIGNGSGDIYQPDRAQMSLRFERSFTNPGNYRAFEYHSPQIWYPGGIVRRPESGYFSNDVNLIRGSVSYQSDYYVFSDYKTGTPKVNWGLGENDQYNGYVKGLTFLDTASIFLKRSFAPNTGFFGRKANNSADIKMLSTTAADRVAVGGAGETGITLESNVNVAGTGHIWSSAGELTVGGTSPTRLSVVSSNEEVQRWGNQTSNALLLRLDGPSTNPTIASFCTPLQGYNYPVRFDLRAPSSSFHILQNGNVGFGTASPTARIHSTAGIRAEGLAGTGNRLAQVSSDGTFSASIDAASVVAATGTTNQTLRHDGTSWIANSTLTVNNSGNVQIGAPSPTTSGKLEINNSYTNTMNMNLVLTGGIPGLNIRNSQFPFTIVSGYADNNLLSFLGTTTANANPTSTLFQIRNNGDIEGFGTEARFNSARLIGGGSGHAFGANSAPSGVFALFSVPGGQRMRTQASSGLSYTDYYSAATGANRNYSLAYGGWNGPGDFAFLKSTAAGSDPNQIVWYVDATTQNLGIGQASATTALDVSGSIRATSLTGSGNRLTQVSSTGIIQPTTIDPSTLFNKIGVFSNTANARGLSIVADSLKLHAANFTNPGGVNVGNQTWAGTKTIRIDNGSGSVSPLVLLNNADNDGQGVALDFANASTVGGRVLLSNPNGTLASALDIIAFNNAGTLTSYITMQQNGSQLQLHNALYQDVFNGTSATETLTGLTSVVNIPSTSSTTAITLPEIVSGVPGANQVNIGYELELSINRSVSVTINRSGADVILVDGQTATATSVSTTANTFFIKRFRAISLDNWIIF